MSFLDRRTLFAYTCVGLMVAATVWAVRFPDEPPADFTFVNNTELKSIDPAIVTGQPEGRVLQGLFEGLTGLDEKNLDVIPAIADRWEISDDKLSYTFHLRPTARWSDGSTITAQDIHWSMRRFLDPATAAQYAYQAWYIKNAGKYSKKDIQPGDPVEIELHEKAPGALPFARGKMIYGTATKVEVIPAERPEDVRRRYSVTVGGEQRVFVAGGGGDSAEDCKQVLFDFREVGIRAIDASTVQIRLDSPTPFFLSLLAFYPLFPVQPKCVETYGFPNWTKPGSIVTGGPFHLHSRRIRDRLRMTRSATYWDREHVRCQIIDVLAVESVATGFNLYLTGKADWIATVPSPIIPELLAEQRADFRPIPELTVYFYRINVTKPPLDQKLVRQALACAINKRQIVQTVTRAGELPASSFVPPGFPGYQSPAGLAYNPDQARRLLADAGHAGGAGLGRIPILYNTDEAHQSIAELIQDQWKRALGIDVVPQNQPWSSYLESQRTLKYSVARAGWGGDYLDPNTFLDLFVTGGENNETGWSNADYDRLIQGAAYESDPARRMEMFRQAEAILLDEAPIIPIYFRVSKNMVRPYVKGFYNNLLDTHPLKAMDVDADAKRRMFDDLQEREKSESRNPKTERNANHQGANDLNKAHFDDSHAARFRRLNSERVMDLDMRTSDLPRKGGA